MYRSSYTIKIPTRPFLPSIQPGPSNRRGGAVSLSFSWPCCCCCCCCYLLPVFLGSNPGFLHAPGPARWKLQKCPVIPSTSIHP
ncbi:hypothetical protein CGRA01v4_00244 [Colletotrichum graminicola]|nr:hypothetical protein CGRA01v4_00244 [Colletotrichum graminicola]